jgi:putative cardiolipin synthase
LVALAQRGVKVRILTNSLASAEASVVHAGYAKRRRDLLRAGVELYELKPVAGESGGRETVPGPSVGTGLHAKTYAVDRAKIFVGSFNFDQRSAHLNTEMGLVIDSAALAERLANAFETVILVRSWKVRLAKDGSGLEWVDLTADESIYTTEPETSWWRRFRTDFMSIMPIEWLL